MDQALNVPFAVNPLPDANMTISPPPLQLSPEHSGQLLSSSISSDIVFNGSKIVPNDSFKFFTGTCTPGLPLSCKLNGVRCESLRGD